MTTTATTERKAATGPQEAAGFRLLHTMIRVLDLEKSLDFYTRHLGMKVLRRQDYPGGRFTLAFIGYGDESDHTVIELTHNWDQKEPRPKACTPSSEPMSKQATPPGPTAGPAIPASPALPMSRTSSARWPPTSSCRGRIASSPTSNAGHSAPITACAASTYNLISTNSPFASTAATSGTPPLN